MTNGVGIIVGADGIVTAFTDSVARVDSLLIGDEQELKTTQSNKSPCDDFMLVQFFIFEVAAQWFALAVAERSWAGTAKIVKPS
jgi:hypothetical protein